MKAVVAFLIVVASLSAATSAHASSKDALTEFFSSKDASFEFNTTKRAVEVCWDLCEYYEMRNGPSQEAWDVVFLHQYYFVAPEFREQFRERYASVAQAVVAKYAALCPGAPPDKAPSCILNKLGARNRVAVAFVRYDEGYRCQVWGKLTNRKYEGKSKCMKVKHAS